MLTHDLELAEPDDHRPHRPGSPEGLGRALHPGLGTQVKAHNERRFSVKFESPGPKMAEAIRGIQAIWDCWQNGTRLNFKGQFYTFDVMTPFFNPGPIEHPRIPI
jgi:hypothetical protein